MTKRIFKSMCVVALSVFLASLVMFIGILYDYFSSIQKRQLAMQTDLAASGVIHAGADYFEGSTPFSLSEMPPVYHYWCSGNS